jgi:hypothetical protein
MLLRDHHESVCPAWAIAATELRSSVVPNKAVLRAATVVVRVVKPPDLLRALGPRSRSCSEIGRRGDQGHGAPDVTLTVRPPEGEGTAALPRADAPRPASAVG